MKKYKHIEEFNKFNENQQDKQFSKSQFDNLTKYLKSCNLFNVQKQNTHHILANDIMRILSEDKMQETNMNSEYGIQTTAQMTGNELTPGASQAKEETDKEAKHNTTSNHIKPFKKIKKKKIHKKLTDVDL